MFFLNSGDLECRSSSASRSSSKASAQQQRSRSLSKASRKRAKKSSSSSDSSSDGSAQLKEPQLKELKKLAQDYLHAYSGRETASRSEQKSSLCAAVAALKTALEQAPAAERRGVKRTRSPPGDATSNREEAPTQELGAQATPGQTLHLAPAGKNIQLDDPRASELTRRWLMPKAAWKTVLEFLLPQVAGPGLVGTLVKARPGGEAEFANGIGLDRVGTIMPLDERTVRTWAEFLLSDVLGGNFQTMRPCRLCGSKYHSRGGWYPFRSALVRWEKRLPLRKSRIREREPEYFYKTGDDGMYDLVPAGASRAKPDYQGLLQTSHQVDAALRILATKKGIPSHEVNKIIACEASFGHGLPLGETLGAKTGEEKGKALEEIEEQIAQLQRAHRQLQKKKKAVLENIVEGMDDVHHRNYLEQRQHRHASVQAARKRWAEKLCLAERGA